MFTVVSDPPEDEGDCVDVAYASVDFVQVGSLLISCRPAEWQPECLQPRVESLPSDLTETLMTRLRDVRKRSLLFKPERFRKSSLRQFSSASSVLANSRTLSESLVSSRALSDTGQILPALGDSHQFLCAFFSSRVLSPTFLDSRALLAVLVKRRTRRLLCAYLPIEVI